MPPQRLTLRQLNRATLARQGLLAPLSPGPVATLVRSLGALQAQHPDWPAFALATRLPVGSSLDVPAARTKRHVVRASLMRMTVHLVAADDFWPMSQVTIGYRRDQFRAMYKLDPTASPLGRALTDGQATVLAAMRERALTIAEIEAVLRGGVGDLPVPPNRAAWRHFSGSMPLVLVPFEGEAYGRARYLPAADWIGPAPADLDPSGAAVSLAERYIAAFGPASADDFAAFVGRGRRASQLRSAVEALGDRLLPFRDPSGRELLDLPDAPRPGEGEDAPPRLLSRWDSLLLAYGPRDRARILPPRHQASVITRNADVLPTFLLDGFVAGTWLPRRTASGEPYAELRPFGRISRADRGRLEEEASRLLPMLAEGAYARYPGTD